MTQQLIPILIVFIALVMASYIVGYQTADGTSRRIQRGLRDQLRLMQKQRRMLGEWVRENWPDEYNAYNRGVETGYQAGILDAEELIADADRTTT